MPRFYFHIHNGNGLTLDEEGQELSGLDAARQTALEGIRSIVSDEASAGLIDLRGRLDIADADGRVLLVVPYAEAEQLFLPDAGEA